MKKSKKAFTHASASPSTLERVGVRFFEASFEKKTFMKKSKKSFTHEGTKHTKLHKGIRAASASPSHLERVG